MTILSFILGNFVERCIIKVLRRATEYVSDANRYILLFLLIILTCSADKTGLVVL